jgi:hypothetical protein
MYKITDITSLGTDYTIADPNGKVITTIQVIPFTEILAAVGGPYAAETESFTSYIDKCIAVLSGFEGIDPHRVLWYATTEEEVALSEIIEYAVVHDYDKIILEHLEELE